MAAKPSGGQARQILSETAHARIANEMGLWGLWVEPVVARMTRLVDLILADYARAEGTTRQLEQSARRGRPPREDFQHLVRTLAHVFDHFDLACVARNGSPHDADAAFMNDRTDFVALCLDEAGIRRPSGVGGQGAHRSRLYRMVASIPRCETWDGWCLTMALLEQRATAEPTLGTGAENTAPASSLG